ncbi:MAG: hypothetical protein OEW41_06770 [Actinomycetota bacterium]|nr:hypothetical protein [Actinomycetota bacterium]
MSAAGRRPDKVAAAAVVLVLLALAGCSDSPTPTTVVSPPSPSASSPSPVERLSARSQAGLLLRKPPRPVDATYRLVSRGNRPDATVRVRLDRRSYRVDVTRRGRTASLFTAPAGLVSCQTAPRAKSCFLVAKRDERPPRLFDPGVQRIFLATVDVIADPRKGVRIRHAGVWKAPKAYGSAPCFQVRGKLADPGTYCFLDKGRWAGALARAEFASGSLSLRSIDGRFDPKNAFRPPVRATPLPG